MSKEDRNEPWEPKSQHKPGVAGLMPFQPRGSPVQQLRPGHQLFQGPQDAGFHPAAPWRWAPVGPLSWSWRSPKAGCVSVTALWHIYPGGDQETKVASRESLAMEGCSRLTVSLRTPACPVRGKSASRLLEDRHWLASQQRGAAVSSGLWG